MGKNDTDDITTVLSLYSHVFNFTNMHAMSHRFDFFLACSSKVDIYKAAFDLTRTYPLRVTQIGLCRVHFLTAMSDTQSLNTLLVEVMISSKNELVIIWDFSNLTLQSIFNAWWASMNVVSKRPIALNKSRHAPSWRFYLHCAIEKTGSPSFICIICHQVLWHSSEHGTRSMGKYLVAKGHIAKLNKVTVSDVTELTSSTVAANALAILKRQGSRGIPIVSLQRKL